MALARWLRCLNLRRIIIRIILVIFIFATIEVLMQLIPERRNRAPIFPSLVADLMDHSSPAVVRSWGRFYASEGPGVAQECRIPCRMFPPWFLCLSFRGGEECFRRC